MHSTLIKETIDAGHNGPVWQLGGESITQYEGVMVLDSNLDSSLADMTEVERQLQPDEYGITPILVAKKATYTQAHRRAQQKYREKFPEKYCELQRKLYDNKKTDDEWKKKFNERSRMNNQKFRDRKTKEMIESGVVIKPRGRPRKPKAEEQPQVEVPIQNIITACDIITAYEESIKQTDPITEVITDDVVVELTPEVKKKRAYKKKPKDIVIN
jgi:hypothetical protein